MFHEFLDDKSNFAREWKLNRNDREGEEGRQADVLGK